MDDSNSYQSNLMLTYSFDSTQAYLLYEYAETCLLINF